jgi:hypothetical protein
MTHLRQMMLEELQRRNYSKHTAEAYIRALQDFAAFYHQPPDTLPNLLVVFIFFLIAIDANCYLYAILRALEFC